MSRKKTGEGIFYIVFLDRIGERSSQLLIEALTYKIPEGTHTIYILISTGGGSVSYGFAIFSILRALPYKIIIHNIGSVDSIGIVFFLAARERYSIRYGTFLIHRVKSSADNKEADDSYIEEKLSCIRAEEKKIKDAVLNNSNISGKEFDELFTVGQLKDAEYALNRGIISKICDISLPEKANVVVIKSA